MVMRKVLFCLLVGILAFGSTKMVMAHDRNLSLSKKEQAYIQQKKVLKVAVLKDWTPLCGIDEKNKTNRGLVIDILNQFGEKTGFEIVYVESENYLDAIEKTQKGQTDLMATMVSYNQMPTTYPQLEMTNPYLISQTAVIYEKTTDLWALHDKSAAKVKGYPEFSNEEMLLYMVFDTPGDCLAAVRSGQADIMFCDIFTATMHLHEYANRDLVSVPVNANTYFSIGISQKESPVLKDLLNRCIEGLTREEISRSLIYNRIQHGYDFDDFVYHYLYEILCVFVAVIFLILLIAISHIRIKSRNNLAIQGYAKSYNLLADTFGEAGLDYDYMEDTMRTFGQYAQKLSISNVTENFSSYLEEENKEISMTKEQFQDILIKGTEGKSYETELECKLKTGQWRHFRLIFSVITTNASYKRPIRLLGCLIDIEKEYQERKELIYMGMHDKLTGLLNRSAAEEQIKARMISGKNISQDMVMIVDVDLFKNFNDIYGHDCGDDVLKFIGKAIRKAFRKEDILCRWGGDEYMLYLPDAGEDIQAIQKMCQGLQEAAKKYEFEKKSIPITLSIGGALMGQRDFKMTFKKADAALYDVKENGRDQFQFLLD